VKKAIKAQAAVLTAVLYVLSPALTVPQAVQAQDATTGGVQQQLTLSETLSANRNLGLDPGNSETSLQERSQVSYTYRTETRTQSFSLNATGLVRGVYREDLDPEISFEPQVALRYTRTGASSALTLDASGSLSNVAYVNPLTDFLDADGNLVLPEDFDEIAGTGTRQDLSFGANLRLREDAPFGITLGARFNDLSYRDVSSADLVDSRTLNLSAGGRFDITEVMQANVTLGYRAYTSDGNGDTENLDLSGGVLITQPAGTLGLSFSLANINTDTPRAGVQVSRTLDLPNGKLSGSLGLSGRGADNDLLLTGNLGWSQELPNGGLNAQLNRSIGQDADGDEEVVTSLSLGGSYQLSPQGTVSLTAAYAQSEATASGDTTGLASLNASYAHALTEDWSLSAGASLRNRTSTGLADANSAGLSLTLERTFLAQR
jgi:hypothetical protein